MAATKKLFTCAKIINAHFQLLSTDFIFDGEQGKAYNGRRGRVVGVRYGDVIVKTDDGKTPVLDGIHFKPENLEKLV